MSVKSRSLSRCRSGSRPVRLTLSRIPADTNPMMATTTSSSISVKPAPARSSALLVEVPVADVGIDAVAARLAVGSERAQVVRFAVGAREEEQVVVSPWVLADALDVAAGLPVLDRGIGRLRGERAEPLLVGGILGVIHVVHGERRLEALDVLLGLGHLGVVHPP